MKCKLTVIAALVSLATNAYAAEQTTNTDKDSTSEEKVDKVIEQPLSDTTTENSPQSSPPVIVEQHTEEMAEDAQAIVEELEHDVEPIVVDDPETAIDVIEAEVIADTEQETLENEEVIEDTEPSLAEDALTEDTQAEDILIEESSDDVFSVGKTGEELSTDLEPYNFERPERHEGDIQLPVMDDAKVFAEFIDSLPAVVNYYTYSTEEEIIAFYTDLYGEPVTQERKRGRLTINYYLENIATRVVISQQNQFRQVDLMQEETL